MRGETVTWERVIDRRVVSLSAGPVRDREGTVFAGLVIGTDVTADRLRQATDRALRGIATATAEGGSREVVLGLVAQAVLELFDADQTGVVRFADGGVEILAMAPATGAGATGGPGDGLDGGPAVAAVASTGEAQYLRYFPAGDGRARQLYDAGLRAGAAAPVHVHGQLWGAIGIALRRAEVLDAEVLARLAEFAGAVATSISSTEAWRALSDLATIDALTRLPNRGAFYEELNRAVHAAVRDGHPLSVVMFDIDRFKEINDAHGHGAGDRVLAATAARMARITRADEMLARLGGEEFGLLLPGADGLEAADAAERLRSAIAAGDVDGLNVTASAGIYTASDLSVTLDDIVGCADAALYEAKRSGRNTTVVYDPGTVH